MTLSISHNTPADGSFSFAGATAWNELHALTGRLPLANLLRGTDGQIVVAVTGADSAYQTVSGDGSLTNVGVLTVTKTSGTSFAASATTDTTNAANITSGTLPLARGGTNNTTTPGTGEILFSDGVKFISDANLTWDATTGLLVQKNISCPGAGSHSENFGSGASAGFDNDVAVGHNATTAVGWGQNIVVGSGSSITGGVLSVVVGTNVTNSRNTSSIVGAGNSNASDNSAILGYGNTIGAVGSVGTIGTVGVSNTISASHTGVGIFGAGLNSDKSQEFIVGYAPNAASGFSFRLDGTTGAFVSRSLFRIGTAWIDSTDASRKARALQYVYDTVEREFMRADSTGAAAVNVAFLSGGSLITQAAALGTTATDGFLYIPTSAGAPTGTPTAQTGTVALQYDTTNNNLYVYNGAWKKVGLA